MDNVNNCDLLVIGAGTAGFSAALFGERAGLKTIVAGKTGETVYSSGLIDLLGSFPPGKRCIDSNPFELIKELVKESPHHPYAFIKPDEIKDSIDFVTEAIGNEGLKYINGERNSEILIHMGHTKTTYSYPSTMGNNVLAASEKPKCLIAGFERIRGFSPGMIKEVWGDNWKDLEACFIKLPFFNKMSSIYTETVARFLEVEKNRDLFAELLKPFTKGFEFVGIPSVMGVNNPDKVREDLENKIGTKLFEIPVMPPSVAGLRMKEAFLKNLSKKGITYLNGFMISQDSPSDCHSFTAKKGQMTEKIKAEYVILATGRFIGKGLTAGRKGIVENLFNLPLTQPEKRSDWHTRNFFDQNPVNQAGVLFDDKFRPVDKDGKTVFENLYATGSILSGNDWKRLKSGSGVAIATSYKAVENIKSSMNK